MSDRQPTANDLQSRMARFMLIGAWAAGIGLLAFLLNGMLERRDNPNLRPAVETTGAGIPQVLLRRNRAGHYVAGGRINGRPVVFLVDTGASDVALPLDVARQLRLRLRPGGVAQTANGMVETWTTQLDTVDVGGLIARNIRASVLPDMPGKQVLLGMSYLKHLELLQRGDTLRLRPHSG